MDREEKISNLFNEWKKKPQATLKYENTELIINHSQDVFICDGIICPKEWDKLPKGKKILFLTKEAYGGESDWDLKSYALESQPTGKQNMWHKLVLWTYGLLNTTENEIAKISDDASIYKCPNNDFINKIAVMNIKKSGGTNTSSNKELMKYAKCDKKEIVSEIELIDPDIIVCGYTIGMLEEALETKIRKPWNDSYYYYSDIIGFKERLFIDFYHPSNHYPKAMNYYSLVSVYQQALKERSN